MATLPLPSSTSTPSKAPWPSMKWEFNGSFPTTKMAFPPSEFPPRTHTNRPSLSWLATRHSSASSSSQHLPPTPYKAVLRHIISPRDHGRTSPRPPAVKVIRDTSPLGKPVRGSPWPPKQDNWPLLLHQARPDGSCPPGSAMLLLVSMVQSHTCFCLPRMPRLYTHPWG